MKSTILNLPMAIERKGNEEELGRQQNRMVSYDKNRDKTSSAEQEEDELTDDASDVMLTKDIEATLVELEIREEAEKELSR